MKILLLLAVLVGVANANFFTQLAHAISGAGNSFISGFTGGMLGINSAQQAASNMLHNITDTGKGLLNEGLQALVMNSINNINANKGQSGRSLRDVDLPLKSLFKDASSMLVKHEALLKQMYNHAFSKISEETSDVTKPIDQQVKKVMSTLSDFKSSAQEMSGSALKKIHSTVKKVTTKLGISDEPTLQKLKVKLNGVAKPTINKLHKILANHAASLISSQIGKIFENSSDLMNYIKQH